jgi:hypothetical protein|tara:strand:+ start:397 stop:603 length:207 start_codon:yes stop_codon:yes gene_type:complete
MTQSAFNDLFPNGAKASKTKTITESWGTFEAYIYDAKGMDKCLAENKGKMISNTVASIPDGFIRFNGR